MHKENQCRFRVALSSRFAKENHENQCRFRVALSSCFAKDNHENQCRLRVAIFSSCWPNVLAGSQHFVFPWPIPLCERRFWLEASTLSAVGKCVSICLRIMIILFTAGWKPVPHKQWVMSNEQWAVGLGTGFQPVVFTIISILTSSPALLRV